MAAFIAMLKCTKYQLRKHPPHQRKGRKKAEEKEKKDGKMEKEGWWGGEN